MSNCPHKQTPAHAGSRATETPSAQKIFIQITPNKNNKNSPNSQRSQFGMKSVLHQMPALPTLTAHSITSYPAYCILRPVLLPRASRTGWGNVRSEDIFLTN